MTTPIINYRNFRLKRINEPQYKHLWWLLFFPIYWLRYPLIENLHPATQYHPIYCPLDDLIPFQEWFIIPYTLWMVSIVALSLYTLLYDIDSFKRYMKFLTISMSISTVIFLMYPSCQNLRPEVMPRQNLLSKCVEFLYAADTNTNVFPSEHAIGAIAVWAAALQTKGLRSPGKVIAVSVLMLLICFSTVFLKQHSILDLIAAIPICALCYWACYKNNKTKVTRHLQD